MKAKKSLGQNFLINKDKIKKIVAGLDLRKNDLVIEIGPGHGELTEELQMAIPTGRQANSKLRIIAIEKDKELAVDLKNKFKDDKNIEIIVGDALEILADLTNNLRQTTNNYKITGNIPYYITGYLLRIIGDLVKKPALTVLTIQKEVAQRICGTRIAQPSPRGLGHTKAPTQISKKFKMNLLAASVQFWAEPKIIDYISRKDFRPIPKVDSAIVALRPLTNADYTQTDADRYYKFIKVLFKQPRKTILNNLRPITDNQQLLTAQLQKLGINPNNRPQDLSMEQIIVLSNVFK